MLHWELYFPLLAEQEYRSYQMLWQYEKLRKEFENCARKHLNDSNLAFRLYRKNQSLEEFRGQLREILSPVYESAKNSGFGSWVYKDESDHSILQ
ncbi:MAG: hypothetical protein NC089_12950 [Bacteroides sp.]|nr:hypothetical protein [Bacteroides sp.]MCM1550829.1 hypothetical protein [Clostridium sp.]